MDFELLIAARHLRSRRHEAGVSLIAVLSVIGVTLGVAVLIVVTSVNEGFATDLRTKILGNQAHVVVKAADGPLADPDAVIAKVSAEKGVIAAAPFTSADVMLMSTYGRSGAVLRGVDPARVLPVTDLAAGLVVGPRGELVTREDRVAVIERLHAPEPAVTQDLDDTDVIPGVILGDGLADQLRVYVGSKVFVVNPLDTGASAFGLATPAVRAFRVCALVHTGMYEFDTKYAYVTLADAQDFSQLGTKVTTVEARLEEDRVWDAVPISTTLSNSLGSSFKVDNWLTANEGLFRALTLQKWVMLLILAQIVTVAALGIVTNLVVMVITRGREIAILKAMGASSTMIRRVFILEGAAVGLVGTVSGVLVGLAACWGLAKYQFPLDNNVYYLDSLPVLVQPWLVVGVAIGALVICLVATLYPASRAANTQPTDALRYD